MGNKDKFVFRRSRKNSRTRKRRKFTGNQYKKKDEESQQENDVTDGELLPATEGILSEEAVDEEELVEREEAADSHIDSNFSASPRKLKKNMENDRWQSFFHSQERLCFVFLTS